MRKYFDSVIDAQGRPVFQAQITVTNAAGDPVQLYSADSPATLDQPVLTNTLGLFAFFVADGTYTITINHPSLAAPVVLTNVEIYDDANDRATTARALLVPVSESGVVIPSATDRANGVLGFDGSGAPIATHLSFRAQIGFLATPGPNELLAQLEFASAVTFPANMARNMGHVRGFAPTDTVVFSLRQILADGTDNGTVATITVGTGGSITRATTSSGGFTAPIGSCLQFIAPADAKGVTNLSEILSS